MYLLIVGNTEHTLPKVCCIALDNLCDPDTIVSENISTKYYW